MQICTIWISPNIFTVPTSRKFYKRGKWKRQPFFDMHAAVTKDNRHVTTFFIKKFYNSPHYTHAYTHTHAREHIHIRTRAHTHAHYILTHRRCILRLRKLIRQKCQNKMLSQTLVYYQENDSLWLKLFRNTMEHTKNSTIEPGSKFTKLLRQIWNIFFVSLGFKILRL